MRLLKRPEATEPAVSESERRLFGGPLRYDTGWSHHEYARLEGRLLTTLRSMPRMVGGTLRLAWDTDRPALLTVAAAEAGQGVTSAVALLVISDVLRTLLREGSAADRLYAALPALAAGALVAVLGAVLASRSTAAAGRLEPKVERAAYEQYLSAAVESTRGGSSNRAAMRSWWHGAAGTPPCTRCRRRSSATIRSTGRLRSPAGPPPWTRTVRCPDLIHGSLSNPPAGRGAAERPVRHLKQ